MQIMSMTETTEVSRTQRSTLTRRVNCTLEQMLEQRTFHDLELGKARVGRITHRIHWHHDRMHRFVLDFDAGAVTIPSLLPTSLPPALLREIRCFIRPVCANATRERIQLDADKGELRMFEKHGSLTVSITVRNDAYEYCTGQLIRLAQDVLRILNESADSTRSQQRIQAQMTA